jgi:hypothetical protein
MGLLGCKSFDGYAATKNVSPSKVAQEHTRVNRPTHAEMDRKSFSKALPPLQGALKRSKMGLTGISDTYQATRFTPRG